LKNAFVSDKVGMVSGRMDELSYRTDFDLETKQGDIILNVSMINSKDFPQALDIVKEAIKARISMGNLVMIVEEGKEIGNMTVPKGMTALATVCAITINGILLHHRIPIRSRFGGILQIENSKHQRFTEIIEYSGSSLDPAEIFIKSKMTSVLNVVRSGSGKVLAGFREIPIVSLSKAESILSKLAEIGLFGTVVIGEPNQPTLQIPVSSGYAGLVILAGLNPLAAVEETGISTQNTSLCVMMDYQKLTPLS
jgi:repressor of nif and glnA expression